MSQAFSRKGSVGGAADPGEPQHIAWRCKAEAGRTLLSIRGAVLAGRPRRWERVRCKKTAQFAKWTGWSPRRASVSARSTSRPDSVSGVCGAKMKSRRGETPTALCGCEFSNASACDVPCARASARASLSAVGRYCRSCSRPPRTLKSSPCRAARPCAKPASLRTAIRPELSSSPAEEPPVWLGLLAR